MIEFILVLAFLAGYCLALFMTKGAGSMTFGASIVWHGTGLVCSIGVVVCGGIIAGLLG